jgi:hypothetical protein
VAGAGGAGPGPGGAGGRADLLAAIRNKEGKALRKVEAPAAKGEGLGSVVGAGGEAEAGASKPAAQAKGAAGPSGGKMDFAAELASRMAKRG